MKILESDRIYLRKFSLLDVDTIFSYRSLKEIAQYQYWFPYTRQQVVEFIDKNNNSDLNILEQWNGFAIINKASDCLIGDCAIKISNDAAEIGCNISPSYQNKGFAKETLLLLVAYSFNRKNIKSVFGVTDSNNIASIMLMKSLGMTKENSFEENIICKDLPCTEYKYSLINKKA